MKVVASEQNMCEYVCVCVCVCVREWAIKYKSHSSDKTHTSAQQMAANDRNWWR
jgi:hypothetical protein